MNCENVFGAPISGTIEATFNDALRNAIVSAAIGLAIWGVIGLYRFYIGRSIRAHSE